MSSVEGTHSLAAAFARTCSGELAPATTVETAGSAARPPIATSMMLRPRCSANAVSASTVSNAR